MSVPLNDAPRSATPGTGPTAAPSPERRITAVVAEHDIFDAALAALVESAGYDATVVEPAQLAALRNPSAILVRSAAMLGFVRRVASLRTVNVIFVGNGVAGFDHIRVSPRAPAAEDELQRALETAVGPPTPPSAPTLANRVRITQRELEILQTYTLGATLRQTSRVHEIAESTVREHYRRVARRYEEAGRPIGNKAQLLVELIADGWVRP
ncbi:helix-turn-helix transcriptional regulator [Gordonia hongkongensis]|uniref:Helix-turn-helix transcriptional regulator n=1 Tax=Gordonia hongkongensis TaxID=1701090 RepID=A0AAX3T878_9ACTN|nr:MULTISPECIES: helix-turn-helix transcriptional regulator [Gordonia]MCT1352847.1 helix-turn-helix transcriptional regulator [Gordonia sp. p3-SID1431]UPG68224.1 helix-turn-helix transcriptional regulator [Gordonia hongkongensis]WFP24847.1 helix-turn-helix transcriptional regulator [Gordonia hongkongensis]